MATLRAAVLIPNDVTMFTFSESYAMGLPILMPAAEWLYRIQKGVRTAGALKDLAREKSVSKQLITHPCSLQSGVSLPPRADQGASRVFS